MMLLMEEDPDKPAFVLGERAEQLLRRFTAEATSTLPTGVAARVVSHLDDTIEPALEEDELQRRYAAFDRFAEGLPPDEHTQVLEIQEKWRAALDELNRME